MEITCRTITNTHLHLKMSEIEATALRFILTDAVTFPYGIESIYNRLRNQILAALPKEGTDEKTTDDEPDLDFDDLCFTFGGTTVSMGPPADGADPGGSRATSPEFPVDYTASCRRPTESQTFTKAEDLPSSGFHTDADDSEGVFPGVPIPRTNAAHAAARDAANLLNRR